MFSNSAFSGGVDVFYLNSAILNKEHISYESIFKEFIDVLKTCLEVISTSANKKKTFFINKMERADIVSYN